MLYSTTVVDPARIHSHHHLDRGWHEYGVQHRVSGVSNLAPGMKMTSRITNTGNQAGMTLVELMVSLAIGSFLIVGAVQVYNQSRQAFVINESIARVQETAQFAMDTIEADIRMASNWGFTQPWCGRRGTFAGRRRQSFEPARAGGLRGGLGSGTWVIRLREKTTILRWLVCPAVYRQTRIR